MGVRSCFAAVLALAGLVFPVSVAAQFQPPTAEELSMTSEPKAPGAAAIYLYREETVDDNLHYHSFFARIKVLTDKGKELATVGVPYPKGKFSITDVKARTVHADGTVIPMNVKPEDLLLALNKHSDSQGNQVRQINKMVFTLPSVEVGSILEYRWQLRYDDEVLSSPDWDVQQEYFVRKAHYSFIPFKYLDRVIDSGGEAANDLLYTTMLPKDQKVVQDVNGHYFLDIADVAPIPEEEDSPPLGAYEQHVEFYYSSKFSKDDFWKDEGSRWSKEMDRFASENKSLKQDVAELAPPTDSEEVKAQKIYAAVMKLDNTDFTRQRSTAELKQLGLRATKQAEDVWARKGGTGDEIALLYVAMARMAGLKAYAAAVADRERRMFNPYFLSLRQLDDVLVIVNIGGKDTLLDPGQKGIPFGQLHWKHLMAAGLRQTDKGPNFVQTTANSYKEATTSRIAEITLAPDGAATGLIRITMSGPEALHWRQMAIENDKDEVEKRFNQEIQSLVPDGIHTEFDHFLGLDDSSTSLMGIIRISGNIGTATGKRVFLPGSFFASHAHTPFVSQASRQTAVDVHYADVTHDEVTYLLPDVYAVESAPQDQSIPWKGHAELQEKSAVDKNKVVVARVLVRAFVLLSATDYPALHDFYQKVATADQQQVVLIRAPAAGAPATGKGD